MGAISLGILAGGRGARLGGVDKAAAEFRGRRLLERTRDAFSLPRDTLAGDELATPLLSRAGSGVSAAAEPGFQHVPDLRDGWLGPLAGLEALLDAARTAWLLTAPVDLRDVPADLALRLCARAADGIACVVRDADGLQPLVALWPVQASLRAVRLALDAGRLSLRELLANLPHAELDIRPLRLGNLNLPGDFCDQ